MLSLNVSVVSSTGTTEGDTVSFQCEDGLFPVIPVLITCNSAGVWSPNPALLSIQGMHILLCASHKKFLAVPCSNSTK